jgi:hypothetical protein
VPIRRPFWTLEKVKPVLIATAGSAAETARRLAKAYGRKCSRQTVWRLIQDNPELQRILQEVDEATLDIAERTIRDGVLAGDKDATRFFLMTKGKDRGWTKRVESTGANGGPQQHEHIHRVAHQTPPGFLESLSPDEFEAYWALKEKEAAFNAAPPQPAPSLPAPADSGTAPAVAPDRDGAGEDREG